MNNRVFWLERINAAKREYAVARIAVDSLKAALIVDSSLLTRLSLKAVDFRALRDNLEVTYIVRMFAEFEAGTRTVWANARKRTSTPGMEQLLDSLASWRKVPDQDRLNAHQVREYRNYLVHKGDESGLKLTLEDANNYLQNFFSRMPPHW